jgi:hypothetical protein
MRAWILLAGLSVVIASAQRGGPSRGIAPAPARPPAVHAPAAPHPPRARVGRPRGGGWGGGWWNWPESSTIKEQPAEFIAPNAIHNPNYQPEHLKPETREFPAGSLPEPVLVRDIVPAPAGDCRVAFQDGSSEAARGCRLEADLLLYISQRGVRKRVSVDLIDLSHSTL